MARIEMTPTGRGRENLESVGGADHGVAQPTNRKHCCDSCEYALLQRRGTSMTTVTYCKLVAQVMNDVAWCDHLKEKPA